MPNETKSEKYVKRYRMMFLCRKCGKQIIGNRNMIRKRGVKCPYCRFRNHYTMKDRTPIEVGFTIRKLDGRKEW